MDFDLLDLREAADKEYWVHLRMGDTLLYADKDQQRPCRVKVASIAELGVEDAMKAVSRVGTMSANLEAQLAGANRQQRAGVEQRLDQAEREAEKCLTQFLVKTIRGWENIEKGGKELPFSDEALKDMAQVKAPLYRLAANIATDMGEAQSPFAQAETA